MSETEFLRKSVKEWKEKTGLSYQSIAKCIGLKSRSYIYEFITGRKDINYENGCKLMKLVAIRKDELEKL